jgi:L-alanine-DL-glutamate epimerase-like enolase superfamily enzyme
MKIASLKLHRAVARRQYGTVIAQEGGRAKRIVEESHFLFVDIAADDGLTGWGEISDIEPEERPKDAGDYAELLAAFMKGRSPFDVQRMHHDFRQHFDISKGSLARCTACALDMAMYDLQGKRLGRPIYDLLGGAVRRDVTISWVAYIREDLNLLREEIRQRVAEGFGAFKLKVGVDIDLDEERFAVLRETAGKEASLKVDANAGWSVSEAPKNIRRLAKYALAGVETPVPRENPADIAAVRKQVEVPILEHVHDAAYGLALLKAEAVDVFNVATTGAGGLWPARQIVSLAEAAGIGVLLGSTVEQGPGTLAQLHLAAITPNLTLPSDLIGPGMYQHDVLREPLRYHGGKLAVPTAPGLGGEIDPAKLSNLAP